MFKDKKLLIFNDWFYPGHRGGGPVQSLVNLIVALEEWFEIVVITRITDLQTIEHYEGYSPNKLNIVYLPGSKQAVQVFYVDGKNLNRGSLRKLLVEIHPDIIYLNGIFSYKFFLLPLLALKKLSHQYKIVICPRGMLQNGALAVKPLKKQVYLAFLRLSHVLDNAHWHATTNNECEEIKNYFSINRGIQIAPNIPRAPIGEVSVIRKDQNELKLIYLSLIAEKKNLLLLLKILQNTTSNITLHIYGPVVDHKYWDECKLLIEQMTSKVSYKGEVLPTSVQEVLSGYHAMILLTAGENFSHALYESLSVGRAIITSYFTPWNNLTQQRAGVNVDIHNVQNCLQKINDLANMKQQEFNALCSGAHDLACRYYNNLDAEEKYKQLF